MKKTVTIFLALAALIGFAACNNDSGNTDSGKEAVIPVSGNEKTYIDGGEQVVFSAPVDNSGEYTLNTQKKDDQGLPVTDENNKWIWQPKAEGAYTWDSIAQTLTLTAEKVADDNGAMTAKANAQPLFVSWMEGEIEKEITERIAWSQEERNAAEAEVLAARNEENDTNHTTLTALINALATIRFNETFADYSYTYTFSNDGVSLILLEALPASVGTDELAGKIFNGTIVNLLGESRRDLDHKYVFSAAKRTYTETGADGAVSSTGHYSYNSNTKQVHLKQTTKDGKNPAQFYDTTEYFEEFDRYPSEADNRASQTYQYFKLLQYAYDPGYNVIDTKNIDEIEGL